MNEGIDGMEWDRRGSGGAEEKDRRMEVDL
jgi:hypothetical protein